MPLLQIMSFLLLSSNSNLSSFFFFFFFFFFFRRTFMAEECTHRAPKTQYVSRCMAKPTICLGENKGADQLRNNCEADQRLCFRYTDSTIHLLSQSKISNLLPSSVTVQPGLCRTWSEPKMLGRGIIGQIGYCIGGNFNIHIWAWSTSPSVQVEVGPLPHIYR